MDRATVMVMVMFVVGHVFVARVGLGHGATLEYLRVSSFRSGTGDIQKGDETFPLVLYSTTDVVDRWRSRFVRSLLGLPWWDCPMDKQKLWL